MVECLPNVCSSESAGEGKGREGEGREGKTEEVSTSLLLRNTFVGRPVKQGVQ